MNIFKIELGAKVVDNITGFRGTVTGRCEYLTGCRQYCVTPKAKDGILSEGSWLDEDRLMKKPSSKNPGGPHFSPPGK